MFKVTNRTSHKVNLPPFTSIAPGATRLLFSAPESLERAVENNEVTVEEYVPSSASDITLDSDKDMFSPDAGTRTYTYDGDNVATITSEVDGVTRVKTYTYTEGKLTTEGPWIKEVDPG